MVKFVLLILSYNIYCEFEEKWLRILCSYNCTIKWSQNAVLLVLGECRQTSSTKYKEKLTLTTNLLTIFNDTIGTIVRKPMFYFPPTLINDDNFTVWQNKHIWSCPIKKTLQYFFLPQKLLLGSLILLPDVTLSLMVTKAKVNISNKVDIESANAA